MKIKNIKIKKEIELRNDIWETAPDDWNPLTIDFFERMIKAEHELIEVEFKLKAIKRGKGGTDV